MDDTSGPFYTDCDGFRASPMSSPDSIRSAFSYVHKPGQIFLVAYPKSGSTWLQHIVMLILRKGEPIKDEMDFLMNTPVLELGGANAINMMTGPGVIKMHLPYNFTRTSREAKYIYLARNPKECCISLYYHTRNSPFYNFHQGSFAQFFELFVNGKTDYGDFFDFLLSWYDHKDDPNVHFLTFEDLKKDTKGEVLKLAKFIGDEYYNAVTSDSKLLDNILHYSGYDHMKAKVIVEELPKIPEMPTMPGLSNYTDDSKNVPSKGASDAKGTSTDCKSHFTSGQEVKMEQWIKRKTEGSDVMNLWKDVME